MAKAFEAAIYSAYPRASPRAYPRVPPTPKRSQPPNTGNAHSSMATERKKTNYCHPILSLSLRFFQAHNHRRMISPPSNRNYAGAQLFRQMTGGWRTGDNDRYRYHKVLT